MVVFVDLDDDSLEPPDQRHEEAPVWHDRRGQGDYLRKEYEPVVRQIKQPASERLNPNLNAVTEAFGCYPVVISIASHLDLNSLDSLSLTCRQVRSNLLQFRSQLMAHTLRCSNEEILPDPEHTLRFRARAADWYFAEPVGGAGRTVGIGKVGDCARDLVGDCRRCGRVVCRNCTIKPPAPILLKNRHRRLCPTCTKVPITSVLSHTCHASGFSTPTTPTTSCASPASSAAAPPSLLLQNTPHCTCPTSTYLCTPCGRGLRSADTTYDSIWRWRTRYAGSGFGGIGTGIGEGNRSFVCGRGSDCERAKWVEEEIDCDAEDARELLTRGDRDTDGSSPGGSVNGSVSGSVNGSFSGSTNGSMSSSYGSDRGMAPGYLRHEIEGIGGVVKKKLVRMVKVGACVTEWEDERERGTYLCREVEGKCRSWCGWCYRVVLGSGDCEVLGVKPPK